MLHSTRHLTSWQLAVNIHKMPAPRLLPSCHPASSPLSPGCRYALNTAGAAARIFTSIQENAGPAMLRGAIISECRQGWQLSGVAAFTTRTGPTAVCSNGTQGGHKPSWCCRWKTAHLRSAPAHNMLTSLTLAPAMPGSSPPAGATLNAILALQIVFYGSGAAKKKGSKRKEA